MHEQDGIRIEYLELPSYNKGASVVLLTHLGKELIMLAACSLQVQVGSERVDCEAEQEAMRELTVDSHRPVNDHSYNSHISNIFQLKSISGAQQEDLFGVGGVFEQKALIRFATYSIEASPYCRCTTSRTLMRSCRTSR